MWNRIYLQHSGANSRTATASTAHESENPPSRTRLERHLLRVQPSAHERLSIVDPESGRQPLFSPDKKQVLAVNGEIYNHQDIRSRFAGHYQYQTGSDCEVILSLYREMRADTDFATLIFQGEDAVHARICQMLEELNGIFAFALYDAEHDEFLIARDPIGVIPLYIGYDNDGKVMVASELKALRTDERRAYGLVCMLPAFDGGLDSSVISAIAKKFAARRIETDDKKEAWWPQLHSFAVGLKGAPDLAKAREVADYIGTVHHEINYTIQEGLDAVRDAIYFIETYDVTTVRASTPMYLLARVIKSMGIKMVLSGEGADEVFGGYLYFHKAPDARAFHEETVRKLSKLHLYDCLRANKSLSAWGVEGRVPFLDKEFLDVAMRRQIPTASARRHWLASLT